MGSQSKDTTESIESSDLFLPMPKFISDVKFQQEIAIQTDSSQQTLEEQMAKTLYFHEIPQIYSVGHNTTKLKLIISCITNESQDSTNNSPVDVLGVVLSVMPPVEDKHFVDPKQTQYFVDFQLTDPSLSLSEICDHVWCRIYAKKQWQLPIIVAGNIIRMSNVLAKPSEHFYEKVELYARVSAATKLPVHLECYESESTSFEPALNFLNGRNVFLSDKSPFKSCNLDEPDKHAINLLRHWWSSHDEYGPKFVKRLQNLANIRIELSSLMDFKFEPLQFLNPNCYADIVCQIVGVYIGKRKAILRVWDGTKFPKRDRLECESDHSLNWEEKKFLDEEMDDTLGLGESLCVDVICWDQIKDLVVLKAIRPGDIVALSNVHYKRGKNNDNEPVNSITMHKISDESESSQKRTIQKLDWESNTMVSKFRWLLNTQYEELRSKDEDKNMTF